MKAIIALALLAVSSHAATIARVNMPGTGTDAASGISSSHVYTHAVDLVDSGPAGDITISSVIFDGHLLPAAGSSGLLTDAIRGNTFSLDTSVGSFIGLSSILPLADGQTDAMLSNYSAISGASLPVVTLTLNGLTPGTAYSTRLYAFSVDASATARSILVGTNADGSPSSQVIEWSQNPQGTAFYADISYIASGSTAAITLETLDSGNAAFLSGFSNQVIPEPSRALLLMLGLVSITLRRRRQV